MDIQKYILPVVSFLCDVCSFTVTCTWRTYVEVIFITGRLGGYVQNWEGGSNGRMKKLHNGKLHNSQASCLHGSEAFCVCVWLTTVWLYKKDLRPVQNPKVHCHRKKGSPLVLVPTHSNTVHMVTTYFFIHVKNETKKWGFYRSQKIFWETELKQTTSETYIQIARILKFE